MFRKKPGFPNCRVCTPDFVIDLNDNTTQKELRYLHRIGYEGVEKVEKEQEAEGGETDEKKD